MSSLSFHNSVCNKNLMTTREVKRALKFHVKNNSQCVSDFFAPLEIVYRRAPDREATWSFKWEINWCEIIMFRVCVAVSSVWTSISRERWITKGSEKIFPIAWVCNMIRAIAQLLYQKNWAEKGFTNDITNKVFIYVHYFSHECIEQNLHNKY